MFRQGVLAFLLIALAACAPRGTLQFGTTAPGAALHDVWVANFRPTDPPTTGQRLPPRPEQIRFQRTRVSIPPTHKVGQIEWPQGTPSASQDFVTVGQEDFPTGKTFARQIARADTAKTGTTFLYVHGYNATHGEAVYQMAQIAHDFGLPSPTVLFSWPTAGIPFGYLYDRDSILIARDQLEELIITLTRDPDRKLEILGHSMGALLIMETLRQIEISGSVDIPGQIEALIMVSPDIDGELFYDQASRLRELPRNTAILAARQDPALRISAFLTGRTNRLGSDTDRAAVRDLQVTVIDTSSFTGDGNNHSVPLTSPSAIAILKKAQDNPEILSRPRNRVINLAEFR